MTPGSKPIDPVSEHAAVVTRRHLLGRTGLGVGAAALSTLVGDDANAAALKLASAVPHFAPKAKRIIYMFQNGAPSHVDLFDYKPELRKLHSTEVPKTYTDGKRFSTMTSGSKKLVLGEITKFAQRGQAGKWIAGDFLPRTAEIVDDLCFVQSMHTTQVNHAPAITYFMTGSENAGKPSMGSWLTYGLGSETQDLPGYVVMTSRDRQASCGQIFYDFYWGNGFLPSKFQGVKFRGSGDPVLYLSNPAGIDRATRRGLLDDLAQLNRMNMDRLGDPEIAARIAQYEMAYKMQASVPELTDFSKEPKHILDMYGPQVHTKGSYAYNCLMARRLAERGCRFVQLMHAGWDQHRNLNHQLRIQCEDTDAPSAALVKDLQQRGLLEDTLVIWGGEFGRTPFLQGDFKNTKVWGRDHHPYAFTIWMAGGGVKPGMTYGASDEIGFNVADKPVHINELQATILHLMGIHHDKFSVSFQGLDQRLTGVEEHDPVNAIMA